MVGLYTNGDSFHYEEEGWYAWFPKEESGCLEIEEQPYIFPTQSKEYILIPLELC